MSLFYGTICLALGEAALLVLKLQECGQVGSGSHGACASLRNSHKGGRWHLTPLLASGFHTCVVACTKLWLTCMHFSLHTCSTHVPVIDMHAPLRIPCCALEHLKRHSSCLFCQPHTAGRSCTVYVVFTPGKVAHWLWQHALAPCLIGHVVSVSLQRANMFLASAQSLSQDFVTLIKIKLKPGHGGACLWSQHTGGWDRKIVSLRSAYVHSENHLNLYLHKKIHYFPPFKIRCSQLWPLLVMTGNLHHLGILLRNSGLQRSIDFPKLESLRKLSIAHRTFCF